MSGGKLDKDRYFPVRKEVACPYCGTMYHRDRRTRVTCGKERCRHKHIVFLRQCAMADRSDIVKARSEWIRKGWIKRRIGRLESGQAKPMEFFEVPESYSEDFV